MNKITIKKFDKILLKKVIKLAINSSSLRNQVHRNNDENTFNNMRGYLIRYRITLSKLQKLNIDNYSKWFNNLTKDFVIKFKKNDLHLGSARKVLNLIMEDIYFNYKLRKYIKNIWDFLEIPVDSLVHKYLYKRVSKNKTGFKIINLDDTDNKCYQDEAIKTVKKIGLKRRIELDPCIWVGDLKSTP